MSRSKYKASNPTQAAALNIPDLASAAMNELRQDIETLAALKVAILQELNGLPFIQKSILYDFYIKGLQWSKISSQAHYSITQCKNIRNIALDKLSLHFAKNNIIINFMPADP